MKKITIGILCVLFIAGGIYFYSQQKSSAAAFDTILPSQSVAYIEVSEVEKNLNRLFDTRLYSELSAFNPGPAIEGDNPFKMLQDTFQNDPNAAGVRAFLKHKFALAFYDVDMDFSSAVDSKIFPTEQLFNMLENIFVAVQLDAGTKAAEKWASSFKSIGQDITVTEQVYAEKSYNIVHAQGDVFKIYYVVDGDMMVAAFSETAIKKIIDVQTGGAPSLASDESFQKARTQNSGDVFGYYSFPYLKGIVQKVANSITDSEAKKQTLKQLAYFDGFNSMSTHFDWQDNMLFEAVIDYDLNRLHSKFKGAYQSCIGSKNNTLKYVPQNVMLYHWGGCIDWQQMVNEMNEGMADVPGETPGMMSGYMQAAGEYIKVLEDNIGLYITGIQQGMFPIPEVVLFIGLKDPDMIRQMLESFMNNPMVRVEKENYNGHEILKIIPPVNVVTPGAAFTDKYVIISTHLDKLKQAFDLSDGQGMGLADNAMFKQLGLGAPDNGSLAQYIEVGRLVNEILKFEDFGKSMIRQQAAKQEAFREGSVRRLEDVRTQIKLKEEQMNLKKKEIVILEDEIFLNDAKGLDSTAQKEQISTLKSDIASFAIELDGLRDQERNTAKVLTSFDEDNNSAQQMEENVDDFAIPALNIFKNVGVYTSKSAVEEKQMKSKILLDIK